MKASNFFLILLILNFSKICPLNIFKEKPLDPKVAVTLSIGLAGYGLLKYYTPEKFIPSTDNLFATTLKPIPNSLSSLSIYDYMSTIKNGIQNSSAEFCMSKKKNSYVEAQKGIMLDDNNTKDPVFVYSPYFLPSLVKAPKKFDFYIPSTPGRSIYASGFYIGSRIIPGTTVTFQYPDNFRLLNVAQELDQECLKKVTTEVVSTNHDFILIGSCRGAANILTFLTTQPFEHLKHVKAAIVEAPPFSLKDICEQTMRALPILSLFPNYYGTKFLYGLYRLAFPNHKYQESSILENINNIPKDLPILIIHVKEDSVVYDENVKKLLIKLLETGHTNINFVLFDNKKLDHYNLCTASIYPNITNAFLKKYKLPNINDLAEIAESKCSQILNPLSCPSDLSNTAYINKLWKDSVIDENGSFIK